MDFHVRTMVFLLWMATRGGQCPPMRQEHGSESSSPGLTNMLRPSSQYCNKLYEKKQYKILKYLVFPFKYCFFCPIPIFSVQIRFFPSRSSSLRPDIVFSVQGLDLSIWIRIFPYGSDFFCLNPTGSGTATNTSAAIPDLSWRSRIPPHH